jgi:hypothetical protein
VRTKILLGVAFFFLVGCAPVIRHAATGDTSSLARSPEIAGSGGQAGMIYVAWSRSNVLNFAAAVQGQSLGTPQTPMPGVTIRGSSGPVSLASWGSRVHVAAAVSAAAPPPGDVHVVTSTNSGAGFGAPARVSFFPEAEDSVRVATSATNVSVVFVRQTNVPLGPNPMAFDQVYVASSSDGGQTFSAPRDLSNPVSPGASARVAVNQNRVYVLWCRPTANNNNEARLSVSNDGGGTYGNSVPVSASVRFCTNTHLVAEGTNKVHALWQGMTGTIRDVFVATSLDGGATFTQRNVSSASRTTSHPAFAVSGTNVYVAWEQDTGNNTNRSDIFFAASTDEGGTFSAPTNLSPPNTDGESTLPAVAASGRHVHVLWTDLAVGNYDIFYRRSEDSGASFNQYRLMPRGASDPLHESDSAAIARGTDLYAVWTRDQPIGSPHFPSSDLFFYSKRSCPTMPSESGPFRCLSCCD